VVRFRFTPGVTGQNLKVPHMGWNQLQLRPYCPLFRGVENGAYVYFVHSYHAAPINGDIVAAVTEYGYSFPSVVWSRNVFATQFHPEKSQRIGLRMLANFVEM
jgi:glutamine amidotransferase